MAEITVDVSLEDVFVWSKTNDFYRKTLLDEVKECVTVHCEDNGIPTASVDIEKTLDNARVAVTLHFREGEPRSYDTVEEKEDDKA